MLSRPVRTFVAGLLTALVLAGCVYGMVTLVATCGIVVGGLLAVAFAVFALLVFTGRDGWIWALLSIDDPLAWLAFLPPLWRWARRDDRVPTWS